MDEKEYRAILEDLKTKIKIQEDKLDLFGEEIFVSKNNINQLKEQLNKLEIAFFKGEEYIEENSPILPPPIPSPYSQKSLPENQIDLLEEKIKLDKKPPVDHTLNKNFETFIGENLLPKIGVLIILIGVGFGAKYSIQHHLINPLTRILFSYLIGIAFLLIGFKLKRHYLNYSATLVSGGLAVFFMATYIGYDTYTLFSQPFAFISMTLFTIFTVFIAINYDKMVIALFGLVGAYAVPFLLDNGSGNHIVFLSYIALINTGILGVSYWKQWKWVTRSAFFMTYIILLVWSQINQEETANLLLLFATIFFIEFQASVFTYKLIKKAQTFNWQTTLLVSNAAIYYGFCYHAFQSYNLDEYQGLMTLAIALIHLLIGLAIKNRLGINKQTYYLEIGLSLVYVTIAIPVQLDGYFVSLIWVLEAVVLIGMGRSKKISIFEKIGMGMIILSLLSIFDDSQHFYFYEPQFHKGTIEPKPFFNTMALTGFIVILSYIGIHFFARKYESSIKNQMLRSLAKQLHWLSILLAIFVFLVFGTSEINYFWNQKIQSFQSLNYQLSISYIDYMKSISVVSFILSFIFVTTFFENKIGLKKEVISHFQLVKIIASPLLFIIVLKGIFSLSNIYLIHDGEIIDAPFSYLLVRYPIYLVYASILLFVFKKRGLIAVKFFIDLLEIIIGLSIMIICTCELLLWSDYFGYTQNDALVLSILWSIFALIIIVNGLVKDKKHIRLLGIALFGVTIIKIFFYDISNLDTIRKFIAFISLGITILGASYVYNLFAKRILNKKMTDKNNLKDEA